MRFRYGVGCDDQQYDTVCVVPGHGLGGQVIRTGRPFRTDDWLHDARFSKQYYRQWLAAGLMKKSLSCLLKLIPFLFRFDRYSKGCFSLGLHGLSEFFLTPESRPNPLLPP